MDSGTEIRDIGTRKCPIQRDAGWGFCVVFVVRSTKWSSVLEFLRKLIPELSPRIGEFPSGTEGRVFKRSQRHD